jgi:EamA domain-containing membrane protein RarD
MNRLFIILSVIFAVFGLAFTILPMGTLALIPIAVALIFAFVAVLRQREKLFPKILLLVFFLNLLTVIGKEAPKACPTCAHPQAYFEEEKQNY